jgi:AcrR family transcriptional regulator
MPPVAATEITPARPAGPGAGEGGVPSRAVGRPREACIDERVLEEALKEIAQQGLAGFNLAAVARRAGVAKNTVYLRWPSRGQLIRAALTFSRQSERPPYEWNLERDLRALANEFAQAFEMDWRLAAYYQLSVAVVNDPELWEWAMANVIGPAHDLPESYIAEAQRRGLVRADIDPGVAARMLVGAIYNEAILATPHGRVSPAFRDELLRYLLQVVRPA